MGINDAVVKSEPHLNEMLNRVVENNNNPHLVDLSKFPWEQEARHYSGYIFVVNSQDKKSFTNVD